MKKLVTFAGLDYLVLGDGKVSSPVEVVGKIVMSTRTKTEKVLNFLVTLSVKHDEIKKQAEEKLQGILAGLLQKYGTEEEIKNDKLKEDSPNLPDMKKEWEAVYTQTLQSEVEVEYTIEKDLFDKEKLSAEQLNALNVIFQ